MRLFALTTRNLHAPAALLHIKTVSLSFVSFIPDGEITYHKCPSRKSYLPILNISSEFKFSAASSEEHLSIKYSAAFLSAACFYNKFLCTYAYTLCKILSNISNYIT